MLVALTNTRVQSGSRIYFYLCTVFLLLRVLVCDEQMVESNISLREDRNKGSYGTALHRQYRPGGKWCNAEDLAIADTRQNFQDLMPYRSKQFEPMTDDIVRSFLLYFTSVAKIVDDVNELDDDRYSFVWYDTVGDYLHGYLLPVAKYCFYSGNVTYDSVRSVLDYYGKIKHLLDTDGHGWSQTNLSTEHANQKILQDGNAKSDSNCSELSFDSSTEIPLPKVELDDESLAIISLWVPFKSRQLYDPRSKSSLSILRFYYLTIDQCIPRKQQSRQSFANQFLKWIDENVMRHLTDETFYPGLESILGIKQTLIADLGGKVIAKKSVDEENDEFGESRGFFGNFFGSTDSTKEDENGADAYQNRWFLLKVGSIAVGIALVLLIVIVLIKKFRRKIKKERSNIRSKSWNKRELIVEQCNDSADEDILFDKKRSKSNASKTKECGWRYGRPSYPQDSLPKPNTRRYSQQQLPFSDSDEDNDFLPFQPNKNTERIPLIAKDTAKKRKSHCGRGCLCMNCTSKAQTSNESHQLRSSSSYKLVNETALGAAKPKKTIDPSPSKIQPSQDVVRTESFSRRTDSATRRAD
ncbi:uncharacterized protein LOC131437881 [Malaya genurostris]|uniref:uncharacterized protein LOC131437881 n=1 Tax=Malaya genurostris TaxID=325434 RepID=UPI0026F382D5|nr:uncharacterized protein LOC131437881 [Malaya genurostris]